MFHHTQSNTTPITDYLDAVRVFACPQKQYETMPCSSRWTTEYEPGGAERLPTSTYGTLEGGKLFWTSDFLHFATFLW